MHVYLLKEYTRLEPIPTEEDDSEALLLVFVYSSDALIDTYELSFQVKEAWDSMMNQTGTLPESRPLNTREYTLIWLNV